ncbi:MAG: sigma-70 family RNA polymerase sigma factor [Rhodothermales bacterium]|nr:sigma-70 family RNA polymerase sigma factor [Rhodothermales bacterium]MBO6778185.1 sigma-70 family RNA polymerase sigma factor [Rhodothermales bacterium]
MTDRVTPSPSKTLPERIQQSDREAFESAVTAYQDALYRYAAGIAGSASAGDVVQDVFLKLWEMRESLSIRISLKALLYRMTRNRALNMRRKLRRVELPGELPEPGAPDQESSQDLERLVREGIRAMPPRRSEAFLLSRYHALTHDQIARIMGLSVRTVQTHIVHALRDLRAHLDLHREAGMHAEEARS